VKTENVIMSEEFSYAPSVWWSYILFPLRLLCYYFSQISGKKCTNTTSTSRTNSPIFSNHIVRIEKMDGSNNSTWVFEIGLWLSGLGCKSRLTVTTESVPTKQHELWITIDAWLCNVIKSTIHTSLKPIFNLHKEMSAQAWSEAHVLYTNDTTSIRCVSRS